MPGRPLVVAGGSIAALVTADAALRRGRRVRLLLPRRGVGNGFLPLERDGRRLGLGVRLLELDREDAGAPPPLADYRPAAGAHAPWVRRIAEWAGELVPGRLREVDRPAMAVGGRLVDDIYFTVDLEGLDRALPAGEARRTAAEAAGAVRAGGAAGVLDGRPLDGLSLDEASRANHGDTFHERFIAPMAAKIHPGGAAAVPAALRRRIWMPLFHPRTLERAAAGLPTGYRPRRPFHTVAPGGAGELVEALLARIRRAPGARIETVGRLAGLRAHGPAVAMRFDDGRVVSAARPVIGVGPDELFRAAGIDFAPGRMPMSIAWADVAERDLLALPSVVHLPDPSLRAFRISAGDDDRPGRRQIVAELRHDVPAVEAAEAVRGALVGAGLAREGAAVDLLHHLAVAGPADPSAACVAAFAAARERLDAVRLPAEIVGGASAFGADSLNEMVIQGLRAEEMSA